MKTIKTWIRKIILDLLISFASDELPLKPDMLAKDRIMLMSKLYQNPALTLYLETREAFIVQSSIKLILESKMDELRGLGGQLVELSAMRREMRMCYNRSIQEHQERNRKVANDVPKKRGQTRKSVTS